MNQRTLRSSALSVSVLVSALALSPSPALAQPQAPDWLRTLDELMAVEVTTSSRRHKRLADTAAAVFVVTREDIRRSGMTTVPDLLRLAPGVHVAQIDGNKWAVTVRGFNGRWANKLLVMIDGRAVYSDVFSGVFWDALDVPIEVIERIEIVRGPGGSLWGANAVNGVINIITQSAGSSGGAVTATAGSIGQRSGTASYAAALNTRLRYHAFLGAAAQDDSVAVANDDWRSVRGGIGASADLSPRDTVEIKATALRSDGGATIDYMLTTAPRLGIEDLITIETLTQHVSARWTRALGVDGGVEVSSAWARVQRDDLISVLNGTVAEWSLQYSAGRRGRHEVTWGGGYRQSTNDLQGSPTISLRPARIRQTQTGVFIQDDVSFAADRVVLTAGAKVERFTHTGWHWQPTLRARLQLSPRQTAWASASRAVRTPSLAERGMTVHVGDIAGIPPVVLMVAGNPRLHEESLRSLEAGYRWAAAAISVDLAGYHNTYDDVTNIERGAPYFVDEPGRPHMLQPLSFRNTLSAATSGVEALAAVSISPRWRLIGGYTLFTVRARLDGDSTNISAVGFDANAPRHQGSIRSMLTLPRRFEFDTTVFGVDDLEATAVASYIRLDARFGWRPTTAVELAIVARNLLGSQHTESSSTANLAISAPARRQLSFRASFGF